LCTGSTCRRKSLRVSLPSLMQKVAPAVRIQNLPKTCLGRCQPTAVHRRAQSLAYASRAIHQARARSRATIRAHLVRNCRNSKERSSVFFGACAQPFKSLGSSSASIFVATTNCVRSANANHTQRVRD
jgi:hypothetical protein